MRWRETKKQGRQKGGLDVTIFLRNRISQENRSDSADERGDSRNNLILTEKSGPPVQDKPIKRRGGIAEHEFPKFGQTVRDKPGRIQYFIVPQTLVQIWQPQQNCHNQNERGGYSGRSIARQKSRPLIGDHLNQLFTSSDFRCLLNTRSFTDFAADEVQVTNPSRSVGGCSAATAIATHKPISITLPTRAGLHQSVHCMGLEVGQV